jgi:hypothetical protein
MTILIRTVTASNARFMRRTDWRSRGGAVADANRWCTTKTYSGAIMNSTKGLRARRYATRFQRLLSRYSCTVSVQISPEPRRSRSPEVP